MRKLQMNPIFTFSKERRVEHGQALLEFALIVPALFIMLLGVAVMAQGFNLQMVLYGAAYEGARIWSKDPVKGNYDSCTPPACNPGSGAINFEQYIVPAVRQYVTNNGFDGSKVFFFAKDKREYENSLRGISRDPQLVRVTLLYAYELPFGGLSEQLVFREILISASCAMKRGS